MYRCPNCSQVVPWLKANFSNFLLPVRCNHCREQVIRDDLQLFRSFTAATIVTFLLTLWAYTVAWNFGVILVGAALVMAMQIGHEYAAWRRGKMSIPSPRSVRVSRWMAAIVVVATLLLVVFRPSA